MDILRYNFEWMALNVFLAFIPVVFGWIMLKNKSITIRMLAGLVWIVFLPNTSYLFTDVSHFFEDLPYLSGSFVGIDFFMYILLVMMGILTFTLSIYPFERLFFRGKRTKKISKNVPALFILNLLVGFGMVLGRVQRTNSWEVFTNTGKVAADSFRTIKSTELILLALIFAVLCQIVYLTFANVIIKSSK